MPAGAARGWSKADPIKHCHGRQAGPAPRLKSRFSPIRRPAPSRPNLKYGQGRGIAAFTCEAWKPAKSRNLQGQVHARGGWLIQIGAYDGEDEAKQHLSSARSRSATSSPPPIRSPSACSRATRRSIALASPASTKRHRGSHLQATQTQRFRLHANKGQKLKIPANGALDECALFGSAEATREDPSGKASAMAAKKQHPCQLIDAGRKWYIDPLGRDAVSSSRPDAPGSISPAVAPG